MIKDYSKNQLLIVFNQFTACLHYNMTLLSTA